MGVARQYCGQLGKQDNCQNAVSLSIANHHASLPIGYRMYLPEEWANDEVRRKKAGVRADVTFQTKPEIALELLKQACSAGVPVAWSWRMQVTGATPNFAMRLRRWGSSMSWASALAPPLGRQGRRRCTQAVDGQGTAAYTAAPRC